MQTYLAGASVTLILPFVDIDGDPVTPTGLSVEVTDEDGAEIVAASSAAFTPGDTDLSYTVSGANNTLSSELLGARMVRMTITTDSGSHLVKDSYVIRAETIVSVPSNSFQTLIAAEISASRLYDISSYESATDMDKELALIQSYHRLTQLVVAPDGTGQSYNQSKLTFGDSNTILNKSVYESLTLAEWNALPTEFKTAMKEAQIIESDSILAGDLYGKKHQTGLLAETIGESSIMFRSIKPLDNGVSKESLRRIKHYLLSGKSIGRS